MLAKLAVSFYLRYWGLDVKSYDCLLQLLINSKIMCLTLALPTSASFIDLSAIVNYCFYYEVIIANILQLTRKYCLITAPQNISTTVNFKSTSPKHFHRGRFDKQEPKLESTTVEMFGKD